VWSQAFCHIEKKDWKCSVDVLLIMVLGLGLKVYSKLLKAQCCFYVFFRLKLSPKTEALKPKP
jgi:hypothetical protein